MNLAIFASHFGSTLQAIIDAHQAGRLAATPVLVVSNNSGSEALNRARRAGITALHLSSKTHPTAAELDQAIVDALEKHQVDAIVLAGYMKKLGTGVLAAYSGRIINTHPALLPKFGGKGMYGAQVHEAVIASGDTETGVSIHVVDEDYDTGALIAQERLAVLPEDDPKSLATRVQQLEKQLLVKTLDALARGQLRLAEPS